MSKLTVKEHNGYYLASNGAWSPDGIAWFDEYGIDLNGPPCRIALREYLDSKANPEAEPEPDVFTGDPGEWGKGVYRAANDSRFILISDGKGGDWVELYVEPGDISNPVFVYRESKQIESNYHRISDNPLDAINPAMWEVE